MYDFDELVDRRNTNSYKWDEHNDPDIIPLWVADMDFKAAPCITKALEKRIRHGVFGYTFVPDSYYEAVINWFNQRHGWTIQRPWMLYTTGVVPAISAVIKALTQPGDAVLIQSPVYNCFFSSIRNNQCHIVESPLKVIDIHQTPESFTYETDWEDFEKKCADPRVKLFLLCNPHNPAGRVWTPQELERMNDICLRHGVRVIADEIHCELVMPGYRYTPYASISQACLDNSITCSSASKSFNIAGLQMAHIISNDPKTRQLIDRAININEICDVNPFAPIAQQAAYNEGGEWLDQLCDYLYNNKVALCQYFASELPELKVARLEGTYLVWVNIRATGLSSDELTQRLLNEGKVQVNSGTMYGVKTGEGFIRINIACPRSQLMEGLRRIKQTIEKL
ncbi:MAG: pyridoxal phosphate-dependent aminotransferase [Prevotella sp.]|nr:pyridoxal phosphate-dependent aminotransferase [Prevotella sp.]